MSLQANDDFSIPAETVRVARLSLPRGNVYLRMRDELGVWCHDGDFADWFSRRGQTRVAKFTALRSHFKPPNVLLSLAAAT